MSADVGVGKLLLDLRHMTGDAIASCATGRVMRVSLDGGRMWTIGRFRTVALQTENVCRLQQIGVVLRSVNVVATETTHAVRVHGTLYKVVALHPILMRGVVREMSERLLAELMFFELPEILEIHSNVKANWPIVVFTVDGITQRLSLRMTLNADVRCLNGV